MPLSNVYIYRMVHIDNVPHILQNGITHKTSPNANSNYAPIGDSSIIISRNGRTISVKTASGQIKNIIIGDFIPFYFGYRTPMLYVIQKGFNSVTPQSPENIIYLVCNVQGIIDAKLEFYFTDGHAIDSLSTCYDKSFAGNIKNLVDIRATKLSDWTQDRDDKRKKEAEFLIL